MRALLAWPLASALMLSLVACAGLAERRDGYRVDHSHRADAYNSRVRHLVLHYTSHGEARALATLTGPRVSSHYLVPVPAQQSGSKAPRIYQLVPEHERAWHAGVSAWGARSNLNDTSIGIEIINDGPVATAEGWVWSAFPAAQIEAVIALLKDLSQRYQIDPINIVAHSDIAPQRKIDPGPAFPWQQLYRAGLGTWPDADAVQRHQAQLEKTPPSLRDLQEALAAWGYPIRITAEADAQTCAVVRAFQMRYRATDYRGAPDLETAAILWALLEKYRPALLPPTEATPSIAGTGLLLKGEDKEPPGNEPLADEEPSAGKEPSANKNPSPERAPSTSQPPPTKAAWANWAVSCPALLLSTDGR